MPRGVPKAGRRVRKTTRPAGQDSIFGEDTPTVTPVIPAPRNKPVDEALTSPSPDASQVVLGRPSNRSRYLCGWCGTRQCHRCPGGVRNGGKVVAELIKEKVPPEEAAVTVCACARKGHQGTLVPTARTPEMPEEGRG